MRVTPDQMRLDRDAPVAVVRPGTVGYLDAWDAQKATVTARQEGAGRDHLVLLEHPPVYTLGKRTDQTHLLFDADQRTEHGIELVQVDRGGDITYHGPGQLVGYPILRLASVRSVVEYVRALEEVVIRTLAGFGITGRRVQDFTGVWVGDAKIAAIGVRVASKGVTSHGFALNVNPQMDHFNGIVPCGIDDRDVTSMALLGATAPLSTVADEVERVVAEVFGATLEPAADHDIFVASTRSKVSP